MGVNQAVRFFKIDLWRKKCIIMIDLFCVSVLRASSSSVPDNKMFVIYIYVSPVLRIIEFSEERDIGQNIQSNRSMGCHLSILCPYIILGLLSSRNKFHYKLNSKSVRSDHNFR